MKPVFQNIENLQPEVDYQALMAQMTNYSHPRRKLKELQNNGYLIRLKKGFYVLSKELVHKDYSPQIISNLLYGPSYLSLEYALSYYNLIPERVETYTSVTSQKNKLFKTPIGNFSYKHLSLSLYPIGVGIKYTTDQRAFLIATPEKALLDVFSLKFSNLSKPNLQDILVALTEDLRIDIEHLKKIINIDFLEEISPHYKNRRWNKLLIDFLLEQT